MPDTLASGAAACFGAPSVVVQSVAFLSEMRRPRLRNLSSAPGYLTSFHQILILILAKAFLGGSDASLSELVHENVRDADRREAAVAIAEELEREVDGYGARYAELRTELMSVVRRYDATAAELEAALLRGVSEAEQVERAIVDARFRLRAELEPAEWRELCAGLSRP